jgi:glycosyltransferase involved in cell wall biosynthesis
MSARVALGIPESPARTANVSAQSPGVSDHPATSTAHDPLVSVIIPCYNGEAFLKEAIESALTQSYQRVEVIVVDDGSTDKSSEIAQTLPVRYIQQEHRGLTASRNLGIVKSRGSYIVFLDADDRLKPDAIKTGLRVLEQHPECAMTVGDHLFLSEDGSHLSDSHKDCLLTSHYEALLKSNFIEMISSVLFRRSALDEVGGFDTDLRVAEDYDLYLRIARVYPICCHQAVVAEYRLHKSNASHNSELMLTTTLRVLQSQARYIRGDARRLFAFLEGNRNWRKQYGRQLASELAHSFPTLRFDHLRRKLMLLIKNYPQGLIILLLLRMMPRLHKRRATVNSPVAIYDKTLSSRLHAWLNASKPPSTTQIG